MEIGQVPAYKRWSNRYSYAFKMEVIEAFQSGQMSQRQDNPKVWDWQTNNSCLGEKIW